MSILNKSQILLVDDHELVRRGLRLLIDGEPDMKVCCEAESIRQVQHMKQHITPDAAILDISLPDGNGIELAKSLHQWRPQMSILILSMYEDDLFAERALSAGAMGYINKQNSAEKILLAIRRVLSNKPYIDNQLTERLAQRPDDKLNEVTTSPIEVLSAREMQVFELIGLGSSTAKIAESLNLSVKTIETHRSNIKQKLYLETASELIRSAVVWTLDRH